MRLKCHEQLDDLTGRLASMCHPAGEAIAALIRTDLPLTERVFDLTEQIEQSHGPGEEQTLALQAPGVHLVSDLSRMGGPARTARPDGAGGGRAGPTRRTGAPQA
jgi:phosphate transport system protein